MYAMYSSWLKETSGSGMPSSILDTLATEALSREDLGTVTSLLGVLPLDGPFATSVRDHPESRVCTLWLDAATPELAHTWIIASSEDKVIKTLQARRYMDIPLPSGTAEALWDRNVPELRLFALGFIEDGPLVEVWSKWILDNLDLLPNEHRFLFKAPIIAAERLYGPSLSLSDPCAALCLACDLMNPTTRTSTSDAVSYLLQLGDYLRPLYPSFEPNSDLLYEVSDLLDDLSRPALRDLPPEVERAAIGVVCEFRDALVDTLRQTPSGRASLEDLEYVINEVAGDGPATPKQLWDAVKGSTTPHNNVLIAALDAPDSDFYWAVCAHPFLTSNQGVALVSCRTFQTPLSESDLRFLDEVIKSRVSKRSWLENFVAHAAFSSGQRAFDEALDVLDDERRLKAVRWSFNEDPAATGKSLVARFNAYGDESLSYLLEVPTSYAKALGPARAYLMTLVAEAFGDDPVKWAVFTSLFPNFAGSMRELVEACLSSTDTSLKATVLS